jgi:hypothetical protein
MTLIELKATGWDAMIQLDFWQKRIQQINQEIANFKEPEKPEAK